MVRPSAMTLRVLDLYSGALAPLLGRLMGWRPVAYVESDPFCRAILAARITDGSLEAAPIIDDVRKVGAEWRGKVDLVTAGVPCQDFSCAGKRKGASGERNLWPETMRVLRDIEPEWFFAESVPGLLTARDVDGGGVGEPAAPTRRYFGWILGTLASLGFDAEWTMLPASAIGASHRRERLWLMAHARRERGERRREPGDVANAAGRGEGEGPERQRHGGAADDSCAALGDADSERRHMAADARKRGPGSPALPLWPPPPGDHAAWVRLLARAPWLVPACARPWGLADGLAEVERAALEPGDGGEPHGCPRRNDEDGTRLPRELRAMVATRARRLRALGNGWVIACAARAFVELRGRFE